MKINKFLLGAFALSVGFASCSNEEPIKGNGGVVDVDQTRFLSVQISSPAKASRAEFVDGTADESRINRLDFIFYDANGVPTGRPQTLSLSDIKEDDTPTGNVEKIATSVVPVELVQGENLPAQVICIVNANADQLNSVTSLTLEELRNFTRDRFNTGNNFIMSNSVYFGNNPLNGKTHDRISATYINPETQLFKTKKEAQDAIDNILNNNQDANEAFLVNIYVERLAAKVGLSMGANATIEEYKLVNGAGEEVTLAFQPEYWFMNGVANENYLTKRYGLANGTETIAFPDYSQIDAAISASNPTFTWNDPANHRSYWACSPSYYENEYPLVSDQVNNLENGNQEEEKDYDVTYFSYNGVKANHSAANINAIAKSAIAATNGRFTASTDGSDGYIYSRETTTSINTINNIETGNPAAAVASAVIVGKYTVNGTAVAEGQAFYIDTNAGGNGVYYATANEARDALAADGRQNVVFSDRNGTPASAELFTVKHPSFASRSLLANPNIAGRLVTLQLETVPVPAVYFWNGEEYTAVNENNLDRVNALLVQVGYLDMFAEGLAFFNIPIRHLGWDDNLTGDKALMTGKKEYNWNNMRIGDLGLVRNHVYTINVTGITGLGTGLRSPEQPIIPAKKAVNQYIAMRLNVLAWNVVPAWDVEL